ncbi:MAG TPA: DUF5990 family protein [Acidimicrobiia bacterium]
METVIEGECLPGRRCALGEGYDNVHVGVQRRQEVVDLQPGDATAARWSFEVEVRDLSEGGVDFSGPFVQGRRGDRFVYLSWGTVDNGGIFTMFRRAKLMLAAVDPSVIAAARRPGGRLVGRLGLTAGDGGLRCAAVRPPGIDWSAP